MFWIPAATRALFQDCHCFLVKKQMLSTLSKRRTIVCVVADLLCSTLRAVLLEFGEEGKRLLAVKVGIDTEPPLISGQTHGHAKPLEDSVSIPRLPDRQ